MQKKGKLSVEINRVTGKEDQFKQIVKETEAFYQKVERNPLEINVGNIKDVVGQLQQIKEEYNKIISDTKSNNGQIAFANLLSEALERAEGKFSNIGVMFKNVHDDTSKYVTGLSQIMHHFNDINFGVKFVDVGAQFDALQKRAEYLFDTLKSIGRDTTGWDGSFTLYKGDFNEYELKRRIDLLQELKLIQESMLEIDPTLKAKDFISQYSSNGLQDYVDQAQRDLQLLKQTGIETTAELNSLRDSFTNALYWSDTWDEDKFQNAKKNITDNQLYYQSIDELKQYISEKEQLLTRLNDNDHIYFSTDEVTSHSNDLTKAISQAKSQLQELETLKNGTQSISDGGNFSGVADKLEEIRKLVEELKKAFQPLTDAFADGNNALSKMVTTSIDDLDKLTQKFNELYQMVDAISNKQFNVNNIISSGNNTQNDLEQIRQFRKEAKELYSQVQDLYIESTITSNKIKGTPSGLSEVLNFTTIMGDFDFNDLGKRIKSRSAASLAIVVDELAEWKSILLQFNELRNKTEAGSFNGSKYKTITPKVDNVTSNKTDTNDIADESVVDDNNILNKVKTLSEQVAAELTSIRNKMEEVFDFGTLDFNDEHINFKIDGIYQKFLELQSKINSLELTFTTSEGIRVASEAIKEEGDAAEAAAKQKQEFLEANKKVAKSGSETKAGVKEATEAIEEEGDVAEDSAKRIAMVQQANSSFETANKISSGDTVKLKGLSQADFELYATEIAKSKGLTIDDISVRMGENGNMMVASVRMVNEELAQSITYTYQLKKLEEDLVEAYLTGYTAKGNQNKALKLAAAAQKRADTERLRADKARAKNNQWLIQQESKLDTQERKYKYSNKSIDGNTALTSIETSLADDADKTIDSLAQHIRERVKNAMNVGLSDELKEQILNDLRILQNEISVQQSIEYSATNMKASSVETNKKAYEEYLNAFEANAKKANVFGQMKKDIESLRTELTKVSDSASMDQFIDNLKVARNKLQSEKAQYAAQQKESQAQQAQEQNQLKELIAAYKEYANIIEQIQSLTNKSNLTGKDYSQTIFGLQSSADEKATKMLNKYGIDVTSQDKLLDSLSKNNILTQEQMNVLLEEDIKHREKIVQLIREASDAETNAANKKYAIEQNKQNKQNQNYGKTQYNREAKYFDNISAQIAALGDSNDNGISKSLDAIVAKYTNTINELKTLRSQFEADPNAIANSELKNQFNNAALSAEKLRKEILGIIKDSQKLSQISEDSLIGTKSIDLSDISKLKQTMKEFASEVTDGQFVFQDFNDITSEMRGILVKGNGEIQEVTIALDKGTDSLYAYQSGTKKVSNAWQSLGSELKKGINQLARQYLSFYDMIRLFKTGVTYVKDIDLAMTELKKVTDESETSYRRFLKTASDTAGEIGSTISDFTDATANFARLGYSINESAQMAKAAVVYKNVADGLDSIDESTDSIISTMKAYGIAANDTMSIIDRFNEVGNNFAITSAGIGDALQRSASALYEAGNTIDESVGLVTAANSVIQNPEQVGEMLADYKSSYISQNPEVD